MFLVKAEIDVGRSMARTAILKSVNIYSWMPLVQRQALISSLAVAAERSIGYACTSNRKRNHEVSGNGDWNTGLPKIAMKPTVAILAMPVSEIQALSLEDTTTCITNWWGLVSCAFFASRDRNCNLRIQNRSALYKWSGAQTQSFIKPLRFILSFKKEKNEKKKKHETCATKTKNVIIRMIEKWSQAPHLFQCSAWIYTLLAHFVQYVGAQGTACMAQHMPKKWSHCSSCRDRSNIFGWPLGSSHIGHIWHDAKDLSFSRSVKGIPIRKMFFSEGGHPLISLFHCYFTLRNISTIFTTFGRRRIIKEPASRWKEQSNKVCKKAFDVYMFKYCLLSMFEMLAACPPPGSFDMLRLVVEHFLRRRFPRKICFQGTVLFLIASFVGLVLCDVLLQLVTSSLEFFRLMLK